MLRFARWKIILVSLVSLLGLVYVAPNFFNKEDLASLPSWVPQSQIVLGLDLQGGSYLLLEVGVDVVIREKLEGLQSDARVALREEPRIGYTGLSVANDSVVVRVRDLSQLDEARTRLRELAAPVGGGVFGATQSDLDISATDEGLITLELTEPAIVQRKLAAVQQSIEILRRRVDELGTTEPSIQRQGDNRVIIEVPGLDDPQRLKAIIGQTAKLSFHLVDMSMTVEQARQGRVPNGSFIAPMVETGYAPELLLEKRAIVSGENLVDAQPGFDQNSVPVVTFRFDTAGAKRFGKTTTDNVGRPFAILLDKKVISAPRINEPILGGSGQISGNFTVQSANDLSVLLRAGALPAPLKILEERTVGAELGSDSVAAGEIAALIGFAAVIIYITLSYGLFGVFANVALIINVALIGAVLSILGATLTLPGIAGVVLTIGMAVDANVLIFERIREEIANGKSALNAIDVGYSRALTTILDANITTFIAAAILFQLGSGPVKGFAVTLAIGILTSVFTAFTVTRMMVALWFMRRRPAALDL
ncbi:MAG: protein translocase subunit SecD [Parvibaculaceae bacterium]|nr:protein translocase subunit SecD [Parvibaculaceae bacterium]